MKRLKSVILDDEKLVAQLLHLQLEKHCPEVQVIAVFHDAGEALNYLRINRVDLLFLDMELGGVQGLDLLNSLDDHQFKVIVISAYPQYAIKALRVKVWDYLLKPIDSSELKHAIDRILNESTHEVNTQRGILIPFHGGYERVDPNEVTHMEADGSYTTIHCKDGRRFKLSRNLKEVSAELSEYHFVRCHHSFVVNTHFVRRFYNSEGHRAELFNGVHIPISRRKVDEFKRKWLDHGRVE